MKTVKPIVFALALLSSFKISTAQCGITYTTDTSLVGGYEFELDFSGLADPGKGSAQLELYNWEGVMVDAMNFDSSFTLMSFMANHNENLDYALVLQDTATSCVDTAFGNLTILTAPGNFMCDPRFSYTSDSTNMDFVFSSEAPYNPPSVTYSWQFEWNISGSGNPASHTFTDSVIQDWVVSLNVQSAECYYPNEYLEDTITAGYIQECDAYFDLIGDSLNQSTYYAYNYSYGGYINHLWDFGDGNTSTDPYPTHVYSSLGDFEICVTVTDTSGCQSTFCDTISVVVKAYTVLNVLDGFAGASVEQHEIAEPSVFPNPSNGQIQLTFQSNKKFIMFRLLDTRGKLVRELELPVFSGQNTYSLDLGELNEGIYFYQFGDAKGKIIISR